MSHHPSPLSVVVKGAIAGLAGAAVLAQAMQRGPQFMDEKLGVAIEQPDPEVTKDLPEDPRAELAERVATGVFETGISQETKTTASQAIHWSYSAMWGTVYGVVHSSLRIPTLLQATVFGGIVGTVASTLLLAIGLAPSPKEQPKETSVMQLGFHVIFGWTVALVFAVLSARDD